jgi:hypothetical protein
MLQGLIPLVTQFSKKDYHGANQNLGCCTRLDGFLFFWENNKETARIWTVPVEIGHKFAGNWSGAFCYDRTKKSEVTCGAFG